MRALVARLNPLLGFTCTAEPSLQCVVPDTTKAATFERTTARAMLSTTQRAAERATAVEDIASGQHA